MTELETPQIVFLVVLVLAVGGVVEWFLREASEEAFKRDDPYGHAKAMYRRYWARRASSRSFDNDFYRLNYKSYHAKRDRIVSPRDRLDMLEKIAAPYGDKWNPLLHHGHWRTDQQLERLRKEVSECPDGGIYPEE